MSLCIIINSFNNKTIDAMSAAILPNLLRLSMLRKPDVTSVVSQTVFVGLCRIINRRKLCVGNSISVAYANMPYCIAKYCYISYESNQDKLQITVQ